MQKKIQLGQKRILQNHVHGLFTYHQPLQWILKGVTDSTQKRIVRQITTWLTS